MAEDTLAHLFWRRVEGSAARPAQLVRWQGRWHALTWGQVGRVARELAVGLLALGVKPGEAVAFLARSRAEWVQADFAIMSAGAVTVPIYPTYMPEQIAYQVEDADAKVLIVAPQAIEQLLRSDPFISQVVLRRVERVVAETNAKLPSYARIKRFAVLSAELSEAAEEVTPTQKLRRKRIGDKYAGVLEDLYRRPASTVSPATSPAGAP